MPYSRRNKHRWFTSSLLLALMGFAVQAWLLYGSTARDDAFLSYWPAHTFATAGELLNYNGERVEQSSALLHTVWLGALARLASFLPIPLLGWLTSLAGAIVTLWLVAQTLRREAYAVTAVLVLACLPALLYWGNSGMETTAVSALYTALLYTVLHKRPQPLATVLVCVLLVLTRPEIFMVLLCFFAMNMLVLRRPVHWSAQYKPVPTATLLWATVLTAIGVTAWRYLYFGDVFPQPVTAKHTGLQLVTLLKGIAYTLHAGGSWLARLLLLGGVLAWLTALPSTHPRRHHILLCGNLLLAHLAFVITSGGDWMEASRFLLPAIPAAVLALFFMATLWRRLPLALTVLLCGVGVIDSAAFLRQQSSGFAYWERESRQQHYLAGQPIDETLSAAEQYTKDALRDLPQLHALQTLSDWLPQHTPLQVMSIQMGFVPYHLSLSQPSRWQFTDLRALSSRQLTQCDLLRTIPRSDTGLKLSYDDFFRLLPQLQSQCGIAKPDVIYDMGWKMRSDVLEQNGYRIVYLEPRYITGTFSGRTIGSDLFIAVRQELAEQARLVTSQNGMPLHKPSQIAVNPLPNIVLLIGDDISDDAYHFTGNAAARTPTLDELAQRGTVFTATQTPSAFCRPSLATFLTGKWPHQTRLHANNGVIALPPGYPTLATQLQRQGYATFAGGKFWEDEPNLRGFDYFDVDDTQFARVNQDALWQFIDQYAGQKPFFVWWAPKLPHTPHNPPPALLDQIDPASIALPPELPPAQQAEYREREHQFLAMTLWLDNEIAKVMAHLREKSLLENTVIIYLADNGFSHRAASKSTPYELGVRTPMIFSWPNHYPAQQIKTPVSAVNLYATVLDIAGAPADTSLPGRSLLPAVTQQHTVPAEPLFGASYQAVTLKTDPVPRPERDIFALYVRDGDWKYVLYLRDVNEADNADLTIKPGMQPFPARRAGDEELFFLPEDAIEQHNLAAKAENAAALVRYRQAVLQWWFSTGGQPFDSTAHCPQRPEKLCRLLAAIAAITASTPAAPATATAPAAPAPAVP